jgi:HEPN domain-containing protein
MVKRTGENAMNTEEKYEYWYDIAKYDLETADAMYLSGRWLYVAYMCQQAIEKMAKGIYLYRIDDNVPRTHNISKLVASIAGTLPPDAVSKDKYEFFDEMTTFYLQGRYPEYKEKLGALMNRAKAKIILDKSKEIFAWLLGLKK